MDASVLPGNPGNYNRQVLERLLAIYERILLMEEEALLTGYFPDLSMTEMHTLAAIGPYGQRTMGETAALLNITTGTLTVAIDRLVRKKYVSRQRATSDRRIVLLALTRRGKLACRLLWRFHTLLIEDLVRDYDEAERELLLNMLGRIERYLAERYDSYRRRGGTKDDETRADP